MNTKRRRYSIRKRDPRYARQLHLEAGYALAQTGAAVKKVAPRVGRSDDAVQSWLRGEQGSPVAHVAELLEAVTDAGGNPYAVVSYLETVAGRAVRRLAKEDARSAFEAAYLAEAEKDAHEDIAQQSWRIGGCLDAFLTANREQRAAGARLETVALLMLEQQGAQ